MSEFDLAKQMAALPEPASGPWPLWDNWRHQLWHVAQKKPAGQFMTWPPVFYTMLADRWAMDYQLAQLQEHEWWRWQSAIEATEYSVDGDIHPGTTYSKDLINQAYHLSLWERRAGKRTENLNSIVEIGAGYGAMALVARRLGFVGKYLIYDLPEFRLLQQWFLNKMNMHVDWVDVPPKPTSCDLFVAIYSLSEMPTGVREVVLESWPANNYLFAYTPHWSGTDNRKWLADWAEKQDGFQWWTWRMEKENDRPDDYRIGVRQ